MNKDLTHVDSSGKISMVDVGAKPDLKRIAKAEGFISLQQETVKLIKKNSLKKGDVLATAEIAGIQAAKKTWDLIPLCHNIILNKIKVKATIESDGVKVCSEVRCNGKTGVEMEALTAVSTALLTVYDMCKAVDQNMVLSEIKLMSKTKEEL